MKQITLLLALICPIAALAETERFDKAVLSNFVEAQNRLQTALNAFCQTPQMQPPLSEFRQAASRWFQVASLQVPATEFLQVDHVYVFWPDAKDRLRKQVYEALQAMPMSQTRNTLPAAVTTLSAIEYILTQEDNRDHCGWLQFIAQHQLDQSQKLNALQTYYEFDIDEQLRALQGTALIWRQQISEILTQPNRINWQLAPGWRSQSSWAIQLELYHQLLDLLQLFSDQHTDIALWQQTFIQFSLDEQPPDRVTLQALNEQLTALSEFTATSLATALNINLGFNNFDGD